MFQPYEIQVHTYANNTLVSREKFAWNLTNFVSFQIRANEKALEEMQTTNYALNERLENVYRSMSLSPHHQTTSLLNEMEMSDSEKSLNASRRPFSQIDEDEDVEVENPEIRIDSDESTEVSFRILYHIPIPT